MKYSEMTSFKYVRKTGGTFQHNTSHGIFNGIMMTYPSSSSDDKITVKVRGEDGLTVVCSQLSLRTVQEMTDFYLGQAGLGSMRAVNKLVAELLGKTIITQQQFYDIQESIIADAGTNDNLLILPIGSVYLNGKYELDIEVEFAASGTSEVQHSFDVVTYSNDLSPAFLYSYDVSNDTEQTIRKPEDIFIIPRDLSKKIGIDINDVRLQMDYEDEDTSLFSLFQAKMMSQVFGRYEGGMFGTMVHLWSNEKPITQNIHVKLTGGDAGIVSLLTRRKKYTLKAVADNTQRELDKLIVRTEKLERESPEEAKAQRFAGNLVSSEELREVKDQSTTIK